MSDSMIEESASRLFADKVDKAARCILRAKQATSFGQHPKPSGGEGTALRTIAKRVEKFLRAH